MTKRSTVKTILKYLANTLSILLYPMLMPTYATLLLIFSSPKSSIALLMLHQREALNMPIPTIDLTPWNSQAVILLVFTIIFTCIMPLAIILIMMRRGKVKNLYIEDRKQRTEPYIYSDIMYIAWCYFLWRQIQMPLVVVAMAAGATLALLCMTIINRYWKISAHLCGFGSLIGFIAGWQWQTSLVTIWFVVALFGCALLLMYARLYLKSHTSLQVVCGFMLGFILTFLPAAILFPANQ